MPSYVISVIVPIYNVEKYLERCVESIVNQTYKKLEIILVDDGSTDSSSEICDKWGRIDSRIVVVHQINMGSPAAKNTGLKKASGDYIAFVDADDYLATDMYQIMVDQMITQAADIVICGVNWVEENGEILRIESASKKTLNNYSALNELLNNSSVKEQVWDKLYRREVVDDIWFVENKKIDDVFWTYRVIGNANTIEVVQSPLYYYLQREDSVMGRGYRSFWIQTIEAYQIRCEYIKKEFPSLYNSSLLNYLGTCMYHLQKALYHHNDKSLIIRIKEYIKYTKHKTIDYSSLSFLHRFWFMSFRVFPVFTCYVRNVLGIGV